MSYDVSAIGRVGILIVATRGADGPGEVHLEIRGGSETFIAWSDDPLAEGTSVLVVEARNHRTVHVVPWHDSTDTFPV
ncbi:MAG TPA: hypothetical protein VHC49_16570 [Mycobacteriales bacterium]|nr:hypothetical protein [Mycobacteriales bacterium]